MSKEEKELILEIANTEEFSSLSPNQIVPILVDRGFYIAFESTFYNVLKESKELAHRGRAKAPVKRSISTNKVEKPCEVWEEE